MRLNLLFVLFAAALSALCAPLLDSPASRSGAMISHTKDAPETLELISEGEDMAGVPLPFPRDLEAEINRETDVNKRFALSDLGNTLFNGAFGGPPTNKGVTQKLRGKTSPNEPFRFDVTE